MSRDNTLGFYLSFIFLFLSYPSPYFQLSIFSKKEIKERKNK